MDATIPKVNFKNFINFILEEEIFSAREFYLEIQEKEPNAKFFLGLLYEFGLSVEEDPMFALKCYLEGASKFDPYCSFRLFFIYRYEYEKFNLLKNRYYEIKYLIISSLFYSSYDNRFNKSIFFPQKLIKDLINNNIVLLKNFERIFEIWMIENYIDGSFFKEVFLIMNVKDEVIINEENLDKKYLTLVENINKFPLAHLQYLIGKLLFYGCYSLDFDEKTSLIYLKRSAKQGFHQAMSLLVDNYHNLENFTKFCKKIKKYSQVFVYNCLRYHANEIAKNMFTEDDFFTVLKTLKKAYFLGDFWSYYDCCEIYDKKNYFHAQIIYRISLKIYENRMNIGEILLENSKVNILALCHRKGIGTVKNLEKARLIYEKYVKDNESKLTDYSFFKGLIEYGKVLSIEEKYELSHYIYKKFLDATKNEDNISVNRQFTLLFNIAKCLQKGLGCEKDIKEAVLLYQLALNTKKYYFYFEMKIKKTMQKQISKINKELLDIGVTDLRMMTLCSLCKIRNREIIYMSCKHFSICEECLLKLDNKNKCPICMKNSLFTKVFL